MAKVKKNIQAWAITYADMVTLLLTFFVLLLVILSEAERQVDYQITKLLDKAHKQMEAALTEESIDVERATKGVKITIRGKLFKQLSPDIEPRYNKVIGQIGELIKQTDIMSIDFVKAGLDSAHEYFGLVNELENRGQELAIEIRCEGHTDDAPIPKDMKTEYESNWQLSSDRSLNVVKLMRQYASMPEKYFSLEGQISGLEEIPSPENYGENINYKLAAIHAFIEVGKELIFSEDKVINFQDKLYEKFKKNGLPRKEFKASVKYGNLVSEHIMKWASKDMYNQTRTYPKYTILQGDEFWKPTPPDYMDGIEPHWNKIRTLVLESADQFPASPPKAFDMTPGSPFHKELIEVYDITNKLDDEQLAIASFWDCNPYVTHHRGHAMFAT